MMKEPHLRESLLERNLNWRTRLSSRVYVTALGMYELYINGSR